MQLLDKNKKPFSNTKISVQDFTEVNWRDMIELDQLVFQETYPKGDPLPTPEKIKQERVNVLDTGQHYYYFLHKNDRFLGYAIIYHSTNKSPSYELTKHIAQTRILVHPNFRRQGIATAMLGLIIDKLKSMGKTTMQGDVYLQSAVDFCKNTLNVVPAKVGDENRLYMKEVNWDLMHSWIKSKTDDKIEIYTIIPETIIEEFCKVYNKTLDREPSGDLEEKFVLTPELQRKYEKKFAEDGKVIHTAVTYSKGEITGLTELYCDQNEEHHISQGLTGVSQDHEGQGFGKWLKAALLIHVHKLYPNLNFVRAGNANANKPMLSINHRMGFNRVFQRFDFNIKIQ